MVGYDRTIVSDEEGTTRDSVVIKLVINQYPVNLIDTAGYFNSTNQINIDSIQHTMKYAESADIIIYLDENDPVKESTKLNLNCDNIIFCKSKQDNVNQKINDDGTLNISSHNNYGMNGLYDKLSTILSTEYNYDFDNDMVLISERQICIFQEALSLLKQIKNIVNQDVGMDVVASHMHELTSLFDECLGVVTNEKVLESIFSSFCVGK